MHTHNETLKFYNRAMLTFSSLCLGFLIVFLSINMVDGFVRTIAFLVLGLTIVPISAMFVINGRSSQ